MLLLCMYVRVNSLIMNHFTKDFYLVTLIGLFVGWLVLLPFKNIGFVISFPLVIASVVGCTLFVPISFFVLKWLSKFLPALEQFGKFAAAGTLNALINLAVLNLFILYTNITNGIYFSVFLCVAFLISKTSSYVWNKFWAFESSTRMNVKEYIQFTFFTLLGGGMNVGIASFLVDGIGSPPFFNLKTWANVSAVIAIIVSLFWNFLTYRYIVFKKRGIS